MLDPSKNLFMCTAPREYRQTTMEDVDRSKADKRRGGGPRVGPFQKCIPGDSWEALPKYDFTTRNRSSAFNERMHVEWECHADHILENGGELPTASVVAKAGFRSCAPCCRDMLALARPTGKTFIMVDLADEDTRGTFHFVTGDKYLPVPKEALGPEEVQSLKQIVSDAQDGQYESSNEIYEAVLDTGVPIDETAQALYLGDQALLPPGCGEQLKGNALLEVLHAEHFARLVAEYGASIIRDSRRPQAQKEAVFECRERAKRMLIAAWRPHLRKTNVDLDEYAGAAVAPLLPDDPMTYSKAKKSSSISRGPARTWRSTPSASGKAAGKGDPRRWGLDGPRTPAASARLTAERLQAINEDTEASSPTMATTPGLGSTEKDSKNDDSASTVATSTVAPDDISSFGPQDEEGGSDWEDPDMEQA